MTDNLYLIGCMPVTKRDTPPPEQKDCVQSLCPICMEFMWVSANKINIIKTSSKNPKLWCFDCIIKEFPESYKNAESIDINEVNWND